MVSAIVACQFEVKSWKGEKKAMITLGKIQYLMIMQISLENNYPASYSKTSGCF
ncbi:MAG: hypothetical protein L0H53_05080 [Candidatus Nitrosocosmicus sp.]|nr:hypothetical protein [Candidatus Nitrosocosmicus sp.]